MFLCKDCISKSLRWLFDLAMGVSHGPCESCHKTKDCIDWHGDLDSSTEKEDSLDAYKYDER